MVTLKTLTIAAVLIAGATSLALAQSGPPTGGLPVAGGAAASNQAGGGATTCGRPQRVAFRPERLAMHSKMKQKHSKMKHKSM